MAQEVIKIRGGQTLKGSVEINGAKNSSVAIIPATLMAEAPVTLDGLPQISDVETLVSLLGDLNIKTELNGSTLVVDPTHIENAPLPNNKVESLRASYYMMGAMLGRFKSASLVYLEDVRLGRDRLINILKGLRL